ncbi:MAG: hypothetical protein ACKOJF_33300 [Planctomycetaceae bacterium]
MATTSLRPGDWIIYCKTKFSPHPGARARNVKPTEHGDEYCYTVDKFWVVAGLDSDGMVLLKTRRGNTHRVTRDDPHLRKPALWERLFYRSKFLAAEATCRDASPATLPTS